MLPTTLPITHQPPTDHVSDHMPTALPTTYRPRFRPHNDYVTDHIPTNAFKRAFKHTWKSFKRAWKSFIRVWKSIECIYIGAFKCIWGFSYPLFIRKVTFCLLCHTYMHHPRHNCSGRGWSSDWTRARYTTGLGWSPCISIAATKRHSKRSSPRLSLEGLLRPVA